MKRLAAMLASYTLVLTTFELYLFRPIFKLKHTEVDLHIALSSSLLSSPLLSSPLLSSPLLDAIYQIHPLTKGNPVNLPPAQTTIGRC